MKLLFGACALLLTVTGCAIDESVTESTPVTTSHPSTTTSPPDEGTVSLATGQAALSAARDKWAASAPTDYTFSQSCDGCEPATVAVRAGEIVSLTSEEPETIDDVFTEIERALEDGADVVVSYDETLGYPRRVSIDFDGDGVPETEIEYADLEAMPIVTSLDELQEAREKWDALGLRDYRYLFRADCTCTEEGTFEVTVRGGAAVEERPLDEAARQTTRLSPGTLGSAFNDLEDWFEDSAEFIDEGFLELDVRMDPEFGYPRWFRIVAENIDEEGPLAGRFEIIVTTELIGPLEPEEVSGVVIDQEDLAELVAASTLWDSLALTDYRYIVEYHCECPEEFRGPFEITIRNGSFWSATGPPGNQLSDSSEFNGHLISGAFDTIERAIQAGTDVDVRYDPETGQPLFVLIDPEAVAVDGGLAFTMSPVTVLEPLGFLDLRALAGPQCPVQQFPPDPDCADVPVGGAEILLTSKGSSVPIRVVTDEDGQAFIGLEPGTWNVAPEAVAGLLGTPAAVDVEIRPRQTTDIELGYDTGIR